MTSQPRPPVSPPGRRCSRDWLRPGHLGGRAATAPTATVAAWPTGGRATRPVAGFRAATRAASSSAATVTAALAWRVEGPVIPPSLALGPDLATLGPEPPSIPTGENLPWTELSRWLIDFDEAERLGMAVRVVASGGSADL